LAGAYSVLRVDLRGWGQSTIPPDDYDWSMDNFASDLVALMDRLGLAKVHLVGAKLGGRIALHMARSHPERLYSMSLVSTPMTLKTLPNDSRENRPTREGGAKGVEDWARGSMKIRLGEVDPAMMDWWIDLYSQSPPSVIGRVFDLAWWTDETQLLSGITVPTLVIDSTAVRSADEIRKWQCLIEGSRLALIPVTSGGRHISATKPLECVAALRTFLAGLEPQRASLGDNNNTL
jgi:pimeloyl-ACP methyl ester carboxylesterase